MRKGKASLITTPPFCFRNQYITPNLNPYSVCLDCKYKTACTTAMLDDPGFEYADKPEGMLDITAPECVEIIIKNNGKVVWINTENGCQFRACQIKHFELKDEREEHSAHISPRIEVLDEMIKVTMMIGLNEEERWEREGRPKNDGYINGSHSGYNHALRDVRRWIDIIKNAELRQKDGE